MHFALDEVTVSTLWCAFAVERPMCVSRGVFRKWAAQARARTKAASILTVKVVLKPKLR